MIENLAQLVGLKVEATVETGSGFYEPWLENRSFILFNDGQTLLEVENIHDLSGTTQDVVITTNKQVWSALWDYVYEDTAV